MNKGKIVQVMGPVVDVEFENNDIPYIKDALEVDNNGKRCVMEVAQHIGNNTDYAKFLLHSLWHHPLPSFLNSVHYRTTQQVIRK